MRPHHATRLLGCAVALAIVGASAAAQTMLNPDEVRGIAVAALMGDPYGQDSATVLKNISGVAFGPDPVCGGGFAWTQWFALTLLSMFSVIFLPRQFQVMVVENVREVPVSYTHLTLPTNREV